MVVIDMHMSREFGTGMEFLTKEKKIDFALSELSTIGSSIGKKKWRICCNC